MLSRILLALALALTATGAEAAGLWRAKGQPAFMDGNGRPLAAAKLCYFVAGTTDALTVYKTADETSQHTQPITLNADGALDDPIFVPPEDFKEVFLPRTATSCTTGAPLFTADNIPGTVEGGGGTGSGEITRSVLSKAVNYTVTASDIGKVVDVDSTGGDITITLIGATNGKTITVRKNSSDTNSVVIVAQANSTVNGESTYTVTEPKESVTLVSNGSVWKAVDSVPAATVRFDRLASGVTDNDPTLTGDSATALATQQAVKAYVDSTTVAGIAWREPVNAATTAPGTLASDFEDGDTIDGVTLATGNRLLIKNQTNPVENGIYTVGASGAPTRATDADTDSELPNSTVLVLAGTINGNTTWANNNGTIEVGVDDVTFVQTAATNVYTADGTSLQLSGTQFSVKAAGITEAKLGTSAVTTAKINAGAVTAAKLDTAVSDLLMPVGSVIPYVGATCPAKTVLAYGQQLNRTTYAALYALTGDAFGAGNGSTTFNVPDLRGRVMAFWDMAGGVSGNRLTAGEATGVNGDIIGATGGAEAHVLVTDELPAHSHTFSAAHTHGFTGGTHAHTFSDSASHTHSIPSHAHSVSSHAHSIPAIGSTGVASANGSHTHNYLRYSAFRTVTAGSNIANMWHSTVNDSTGSGGSHSHSVSVGSSATSTGAASAGTSSVSLTTNAATVSISGTTGLAVTNGTVEPATVSGTTATTGIDSAHNVVQPTLIVNVCIVTGV